MVALCRGGVRCSLRTLVTSMGATYLANNVACTWYGCTVALTPCSNRGPIWIADIDIGISCFPGGTCRS